MDINTTTSSTMTTTDTGVTTQPQKNQKSDFSFQDEMTKVTAEQVEVSEVENVKNDVNETSTKNINSKQKVQDRVLNQSNIVQNNIQFVAQNKQHINHVVQQQAPKTEILNTVQQGVLSETVKAEQPVQYFKTNTQLSGSQNQGVVQESLSDKVENLAVLPQVDNKLVENVGVDVNQPIKQNNKVSKKDVISSIKEKQTTELPQQVVEQVNIDALQAVLIQQEQIKPQQNDVKVSKVDTVQTLIDANKQLANITLIADTKVIDSKVDKTSVKDSVKVDYSSIQMNADDAVFFADLVQDTDKTLQKVVSDLQSGIEQKVQESAKNIKVSSTLMNAISEAAKNNQPLRIDFDKDVSVIIKIDKDGAVNAKFIPGDKAVEEYLRQNISSLRQRFDEQELNYRDLSYSNRQKQNQEHNRRNNKENDHE